MAWDITVIVEDRPGTLASVGEATGTAGINVDGVAVTICEGRGVVHLLVEDGPATQQVLEGAGFKLGDTREVLVADIENRPGALGDVARRVASAGVNIDLSYVASDTRLVLGVDDVEKARSAL